MPTRRGRGPQGVAPGEQARADPFAAEALSFLDPLYGAALRLTRNRPDAEDLVQDTYVKAFRFAGRFERGTNLRAWLFTILYRTFFNRRRDQGRDPVDVSSALVDTAAAHPAASPTPEDLLLRADLDAALKAGIDALPGAFRQVVWLRDVEEFSYAEIAEMLGVPMGTVMSRLSRGRRLLHDRLRAPAGVARNAGLAGRG